MTWSDTKGPVTLVDLHPFNCRWVLDERDEQDRACFCAEPTKLGSSYCEEHHRRMYHKYIPHTAPAPITFKQSSYI